MKKVALVLTMVLVMAELSHADDTDINIVRKGTLYRYETTTIGQAFEASFFTWEWLEYADKKGRRIVEFKGKMTPTIHDAFVAWAMENLDGPELFDLAAAYGYELPPELDDLNRVPEAIDWALGKIWQEGTDFTIQFAILVNPSKRGEPRFQIVYMDVAGNPVPNYDLVLGMIYQ
jgi:hypothetical protein